VLCVGACGPGRVGVCAAYGFGVVMMEAGHGGDVVVVCGKAVGVAKKVVVCVGGPVRSGVMNAVVGALMRVGE
jgi:hypothetical protein